MRGWKVRRHVSFYRVQCRVPCRVLYVKNLNHKNFSNLINKWLKTIKVFGRRFIAFERCEWGWVGEDGKEIRVSYLGKKRDIGKKPSESLLKWLKLEENSVNGKPDPELIYFWGNPLENVDFVERQGLNKGGCSPPSLERQIIVFQQKEMWKL